MNSGAQAVAMTTPLGIADLGVTAGVWYWCRRHEQAHQAGEGCKQNHWVEADGSCVNDDCDHEDCIEIGPFMSEREAERLSGGYAEPPPLGMAVER